MATYIITDLANATADFEQITKVYSGVTPAGRPSVKKFSKDTMVFGSKKSATDFIASHPEAAAKFGEDILYRTISAKFAKDLELPFWTELGNTKETAPPKKSAKEQKARKVASKGVTAPTAKEKGILPVFTAPERSKRSLLSPQDLQDNAVNISTVFSKKGFYEVWALTDKKGTKFTGVVMLVTDTSLSDAQYDEWFDAKTRMDVFSPALLDTVVRFVMTQALMHGVADHPSA